MAEIALPLVEVHIRGYWPLHEQTKQNTKIDWPRHRPPEVPGTWARVPRHMFILAGIFDLAEVNFV